jgi:hypothetical protein
MYFRIRHKVLPKSAGACPVRRILPVSPRFLQADDRGLLRGVLRQMHGTRLQKRRDLPALPEQHEKAFREVNNATSL